MPTAKQITITDVEQGRLYIDPVEAGLLTIQRDYELVGDDPILNEIGRKAFATQIAWVSIPQAIQDALIAINQWTYEQILIEEEMSD